MKQKIGKYILGISSAVWAGLLLSPMMIMGISSVTMLSISVIATIMTTLGFSLTRETGWKPLHYRQLITVGLACMVIGILLAQTSAKAR